MSKRCDGASDCVDSFDETNCKTVVINDQIYYKEFPPLNKEDGKTHLLVNVSVASIEGVNEIEMSFRIKFTLSIEWYFYFQLKNVFPRLKHINNTFRLVCL